LEFEIRAVSGADVPALSAEIEGHIDIVRTDLQRQAPEAQIVVEDIAAYPALATAAADAAVRTVRSRLSRAPDHPSRGRQMTLSSTGVPLATRRSPPSLAGTNSTGSSMRRCVYRILDSAIRSTNRRPAMAKALQHSQVALIARISATWATDNEPVPYSARAGLCAYRLSSTGPSNPYHNVVGNRRARFRGRSARRDILASARRRIVLLLRNSMTPNSIAAAP
jgi:hypothetical protein